MLNKILCVAILGVFAGILPAAGQTAPSATARIKGKIIAARVLGHVDAISKADGQKRSLHDGDVLSDQTTIVTAVGASVVLVFNNGATVDVAGDSNMDIEKFELDPFASDVKVSELKAEPSRSTTRLNLTRGELVGKVVHLDVEHGSEFTVQTPVGAAGIRGTTFQIIFRPGPNGTAYFELTTADGRVLFIGATPTPVSVPAGKQVAVTFNVGNGTASTPIILSDVPPAEAAQIQVASQAIAAAVASLPNGNGGPNNSSNTPPAPPVAPPQTSPTAGSGL